MTARLSLALMASLLSVACAPARPADIRPETTVPVDSAQPPSPLPPPSALAAQPKSEPGSLPLSLVASAAPGPAARGPEVKSRSGKVVAFVKSERELWVRDEKGERVLVPAGALSVENKKANLPPLEEDPSFASLSFSPDDRRVYFLRNGWATSRALFYAEVESGKVFFFHDANGYQVIDECADRAQLGRVITFEHSYFDIVPGSAADLFFLIDAAAPKGNEQRTGQSGRVGPIGFEGENVQRFLANTCHVGKAPAAPKPVKVPARLSGKRIKCGELTLERDDLVLLDGTRQVRFRSVVKGDDLPMVYGVSEAEEVCAGR